MHVDEAITKARKFFYDASSREKLFNVLLEEVKFDCDSNVWQITFGYAETDREDGTTGPPRTREEILGRIFKLVRVNDESGEIGPLEDRFANGWDPRCRL